MFHGFCLCFCISEVISSFKSLGIGSHQHGFGVYGGLSESGLCVFRELCSVSFLVVGERPSVLL